ncbi:Lrp/AsnC family transcriptional regulator [Candidatus Bathyarchaeota archaeon]|nr:Lrp/AsnC family transcriptional regulator [Candidatus Bathyarchaeota archaeon]
MKVKNGNLLLDDLDIEILRLLRENAKLTYTEIGRRLGVAHSTIYERIRKLEKYRVIEKYTIIVNANKIGRKFLTAVMTVYTDPKESENVAKKLAGYENVLEVSNSISEELLIIAKVIAEDQEKLHSFIANSVAPLPGVLRIRTSIITKKYKEESFPL